MKRPRPIDNYPTMLIKMSNHISDCISPSCKSQIQSLSANIKSDLERKDEKTWIFEIPKNKRLSFDIYDNHKIVESIKISCRIKGNDTEIIEQNITFTYFSKNDDLIYRRDWDSESVKERYDSHKGRVMLKFHFDKKCVDTTISEPKYHFHVGGKSENEECYWHPDELELPRLPYPPLDIIILCDIILMNYFPDHYKKLKEENPDWFKLVKNSQKLFQKEYIKNVLDSITNDDDNKIYAHE